MNFAAILEHILSHRFKGNAAGRTQEQVDEAASKPEHVQNANFKRAKNPKKLARSDRRPAVLLPWLRATPQ